MTSSWNIEPYIKKLDNKLSDTLSVIGAQGVTWGAENLRRNKSVVTGNLINSLSYATDKMQSGNVEKPDYKAVRIGSIVVYAARVEFGFSGADSLGRNYNQPAKPYLRPILNHKKEILQIVQMALKNG